MDEDNATQNPQPQPQESLNCLDEYGQWPQPADKLVDELTEQEMENLKANTGLSGNEKDNCPDLEGMVCLIKQEVDAVANGGSMVVSPNDDSKCQDDENPTLASMWSRILRWSQAVTQILCAYDPYVATLLKMGKYPQILMGAVQDGGYPQWVNPDDMPTEGSQKPVTSDGVIKAIQEALLGVWHPYEEYPHFTYFAQTVNDADDPQNLDAQTTTTPPAEGDTALVANDGTRTSAVYTYTGGQWVFTKQLTEADDNLKNFAVTNIEKGYYTTKDVYYFDGGGTPTWDVMDADLSVLQSRVEELEKIFQQSVLGQADGDEYVMTTRPTLADANAVPCTEGKSTIVLITG